jgi:hypothetical protein
MVRLVAAVSQPRFRFLRYFGVLSGHSSLPREVVRTRRPIRLPLRCRPLPAISSSSAPTPIRPSRPRQSAGPGFSDMCSTPTSISAPAARCRCDGSSRLPPESPLATCWRCSGSVLIRRRHQGRIRSGSSSWSREGPPPAPAPASSRLLRPIGRSSICLGRGCNGGLFEFDSATVVEARKLR